MKEEFLMLLNKHLSDNKTTEKNKLRPYFKFSNNGKDCEVSIQASDYHYCTPREDNMEQYKEVELGFPNFLFSERFIAKYADDTEDIDNPKNTVYPYVPLEELAEELYLLTKGSDTDFKQWLDEHINQMEFEVQENDKESYHVAESNGELEEPEDYYYFGVSHGEQQGVLNTLKLIKEKL